MTEIGLMRLCSVPSKLVRELKEHVDTCPVCRCDDSRVCSEATTMVERCVNFCAYKRGTGAQREPDPTTGEP